MTPGHHLHMKSLAVKMGISMTAVRSHLRSLELKGFIQRKHGERGKDFPTWTVYSSNSNN
jgi:predicted ArsR family transcriptional regulator